MGRAGIGWRRASNCADRIKTAEVIGVACRRLHTCAMRLITFVVLATLTFGVEAAILKGRVVGVADGDSVTVLDANKARHRVRLSAIDAPEKGQAFGNRSKQHLSDLVFQQDVSVQWKKRDRYGRIVGKIMVQSPDCPRCPKNLDVGQTQLSVGLAWWYRKHANEQSPQDRGRYESEELEARARRVGLWRDAAPVPPWDFRKATR